MSKNNWGDGNPVGTAMHGQGVSHFLQHHFCTAPSFLKVALCSPSGDLWGKTSWFSVQISKRPCRTTMQITDWASLFADSVSADLTIMGSRSAAMDRSVPFGRNWRFPLFMPTGCSKAQGDHLQPPCASESLLRLVHKNKKHNILHKPMTCT